MAKLYLLDANILINANRDYYPIEAVPEYWAWLCHLAAEGIVKMPVETFDELRRGKDALVKWINTPEVSKSLKMDDPLDVELIRAVLEKYATDLTDIELQEIGNDPFLIAHALPYPSERIVVSAEVSKPSATRARRRVPDVCRDLGIRCVDAFTLNRELGFRTNWAGKY